MANSYSRKILSDKCELDRLRKFYAAIVCGREPIDAAIAQLCQRLESASAAFEQLDRALEAVQDAD